MSEEITEARTPEELAQDFTAMGHSVDLITGIIDGTAMEDDEAADRQDCVDRNVEHLELMVAKDDWGDEDMTDVNSAISASNAYEAAQMIIFSDSEMASMIAIVRDSDIQGSAARLVVGIEDKLIAAAKLVQDDLDPETPIDGLEYEVSFDATELGALVQMTASIQTKGSSARAIASIQDKLEPAAQEATKVEQEVA